VNTFDIGGVVATVPATPPPNLDLSKPLITVLGEAVRFGSLRKHPVYPYVMLVTDSRGLESVRCVTVNGQNFPGGYACSLDIVNVP